MGSNACSLVFQGSLFSIKQGLPNFGHPPMWLTSPDVVDFNEVLNDVGRTSKQVRLFRGFLFVDWDAESKPSMLQKQETNRHHVFALQLMPVSSFANGLNLRRHASAKRLSQASHDLPGMCWADVQSALGRGAPRDFLRPPGGFGSKKGHPPEIDI